MSRWFDILYGRDTPPPSEPVRQEPASPPSASPTSDAPPMDARDLQPVAPLPNLPSRWALEIQKIVFHLTANGEESQAPQSIVFSGIQKQGGTTTISYLVAHHLAAEHGNQRVLFVDFSTDPKRPRQPGTLLNLRIDLLALVDRTLPDDPVEAARFEVPLSDLAAVHLLHEYARVTSEDYGAECCRVEAEVPRSLLARVGVYRVGG